VGRALLTLLGILACAAPAQASPFIHAHRGGPVVHGVPTYAENTMQAFRASAAQGFVLEADVKLTADRQPVVFHDPELDRATNCFGRVADYRLADLLGKCRVNIVGTNGNAKPAPVAQPIPRLKELLALVRDTPGLRLNLEIKNQPLDSDFVAGRAFADRVVDELIAAKLPASRLIVQSFYPVNLQPVKERMPGVETSLLTLLQMNAGAPAVAKAAGYDWVSPDWGAGAVKPALVAEAHALGLRIVPYTIDGVGLIRAATQAGVDELITNDPLRARKVVAETAPPRPAIPAPPTAEQCAPRARCRRSSRLTTAPASASSPCSSSRTRATWSTTPPSARRSSAWCASTSCRAWPPGART
jgi:glycerophosphoryl diester phosphodiesterase